MVRRKDTSPSHRCALGPSRCPLRAERGCDARDAFDSSASAPQHALLRTEEAPMPRVVEFYFDYGSPYSYIAHTRLPEMLRRAGGEARYRIMLLGGVFQATGNASPAMNPLKWPNSQRDLARYVGKYQVPFRRNPHFPVNTLKAMRGAVVAEAEGFLPRYSDALFTAMWCQGEKLDDDAVLARVLAAAGIDAAHVMARIAD